MFEHSFFGKAYQTRDGRTAKYIRRKGNLHLLLIDGHVNLARYQNNGQWKIGKESAIDIVREKPVTDPVTLNDWSDIAFHDASKKGFHDGRTEIGTLLMLIVSELGEALEADRKDMHTKRKVSDLEEFASEIKDTFEDEIADTIIRLFDLCGYLDIDIEYHVRKKMEYNRTRPEKHGKRY